MGESAAVSAVGGLHGFPASLTSFIGREHTVREVAGLLQEYRLVTVTGPGGAGKTRLAGEVARQVAARLPTGVWLAELAPVRDPEQVAAVVAMALGVREQPGVPAARTLARVLARQQLLLVLDNCEHLIGAAAGLCAELAAACDDLRVLATSREPLAVAGEARYRLAPLSLPDPENGGAGGSEAMALFADRARRADTRFTLDRGCPISSALSPPRPGPFPHSPGPENGAPASNSPTPRDRLPVPPVPDCDTPDKPDLHGVASVSSQIHLHAERRQCARSPHPADVTGRVVCSAARATWSPNRSTYPTCITDEPSQRRINRSAQPASGSRPAPCSALPVAW